MTPEIAELVRDMEISSTTTLLDDYTRKLLARGAAALESLAQGREAGMEEAAKICEGMHVASHGIANGQNCAKRIRDLAALRGEKP